MQERVCLCTLPPFTSVCMGVRLSERLSARRLSGYRTTSTHSLSRSFEHLSLLYRCASTTAAAAAATVAARSVSSLSRFSRSLSLAPSFLLLLLLSRSFLCSSASSLLSPTDCVYVYVCVCLCLCV